MLGRPQLARLETMTTFAAQLSIEIQRARPRLKLIRPIETVDEAAREPTGSPSTRLPMHCLRAARNIVSAIALHLASSNKCLRRPSFCRRRLKWLGGRERRSLAQVRKLPCALQPPCSRLILAFAQTSCCFAQLGRPAPSGCADQPNGKRAKTQFRFSSGATFARTRAS